MSKESLLYDVIRVRSDSTQSPHDNSTKSSPGQHVEIGYSLRPEEGGGGTTTMTETEDDAA